MMLRLQKATVAAILRHAEAHPTQEVCGLVWANARAQVVRALTNVHPHPARYYRVAPKDLREAYDVMDADGGEPIAFYHSHPSGKRDPSEEDMLGAFNAGMHYLIAYPDTVNGRAQWNLTAWECLSPQILVEEQYEVAP
jgi:proteasome lid subunit RPN8/RPN11